MAVGFGGDKSGSAGGVEMPPVLWYMRKYLSESWSKYVYRTYRSVLYRTTRQYVLVPVLDRYGIKLLFILTAGSGNRRDVDEESLIPLKV